MPSHHFTQKGEVQKVDTKNICFFAQTNFRNQMRKFGIKTDDRRRHMYVIGKTGMGKTTLMENMVLHDIYNGHGVGIVDPHGDFAEGIIDFIPPHRINDVVYFNPSDVEYPMGFNILEVKNEEQKHLVAAGLMGTFKKIWPDVWSSRMEYILNNTLLALLDSPNTTLLGINRLLADKKYRKKIVKQLKDPVVKSFWQTEFANYEPRYQKEAVAPIQNKIGQFLSASVIRNMVAQVKSTINIREIMDGRKIFVMNLSKGRIGEDNSRLLGGMLITKIQLAAMERVDTPEADRKDFFLYVDEFQNFATPSFANILSEARKYRLSLIMAHQYIAQLDEVVADAVFGNVGTMVSFRVGGSDAETLVKEFTPQFTEEDIVNLAKYQVFLKLMIDGVASQPFSAATMPPIGSPIASSERVIKVSRERYAKHRDQIEDKIARWSGMELSDEEDDDDQEESGKKKDDKPVSLKDLLPKEDLERLQGAAQAAEPKKKESKPKAESAKKKKESEQTEKPKQAKAPEQKKVVQEKKTREEDKKELKKELANQKPEKEIKKVEKKEEAEKTEPKESETKQPEQKTEVVPPTKEVRLEELLPKKKNVEEASNEAPKDSTKKKRKRKRKRKRGGSQGADVAQNNTDTNPAPQAKSTEQPKSDAPPAKPPQGEAKTLQPKQVIKFD